jgi:hypothetical protein
MAKYYIQSNTFQKILNADSPEDAAIKAVRIGAKEQALVSNSIIVSERGFDFFDESVPREDHLFNTFSIMKKAGFEDGQVL